MIDIIKKFFKRDKVAVAKTGSRGFNAAKVDRTTSDWIVSPITTNEDIKNSLKMLVARSRDMAKNNSHLRKYLSMVDRNVIGESGFLLQGKIANYDPKTGEETQDKGANKIVERAWRDYGDSLNGFITMCGGHSWASFCSLVTRTLAIDGECYIRVFKGKMNRYNVSFQVLDSMLLDVDYNLPRTESSNAVVMGVEIDRYKRPVAYHFFEDTYPFKSSVRERIPADQIIPLFVQEFVGQVRGFPRTCAAILDLNMSQGYREAELVAARVSACSMGVWERPINGGGQLDFDNKPEKEDDSATADFEPGKFVIAPRGWKANFSNPTHPGQNTSEFLGVIDRSIANGLDLSYPDFANDYGSINFSSIRYSALTERDGWKMWQKFIIEFFCKKVYKIWLEQFLLSKDAPLPFSKIDKFSNVIFIARRWDWVDPLRDTKADKEAVDMLVLAPQDIIREQGRDPDEVLEQIAEWNQKIKDKGLKKEEVDSVINTNENQKLEEKQD
jgi:lambda family phage portal protein